MSNDTRTVRKPRQSSLTLEKFINSLGTKQARILEDLPGTSRQQKLRKRAYLSAGGKFSKYAHFLLRHTYDLGYVPIHPIITLDYYVSSISHDFSKKEIVKDCFSLLEGCDELWVFEEKLPSFLSNTSNREKMHISDFPEGVMAEIYFWLKSKPHNPLRFFTWREVGIPKYLPQSAWSIMPENDTGHDSSPKFKPSHFAIIDLGSSTVKLSVCRVDSTDQIETLHKKALTVNLAEDFFENKELQELAIKRTIQAILDLRHEALEYDVSDIELIGTGVVREAKNQKSFLKEISEETGLSLRVLSGNDEATLVYDAVRESIDTKAGKLVVINAGGGSTEIIIETGRSSRVYSLPIGISNLNEKFIKRYPVSEGSFLKMKSFVKETVGEAIGKPPPVDLLVYTGGELDYMLITGFELDDFEYSRSHPKKVSLENIIKKNRKMLKMELEDLQAYMPANPNWMGGAISSNALLEALSEYFDMTTVIPSNKNLNDGVLLGMQKD
jgi:hypothetical protein